MKPHGQAIRATRTAQKLSARAVGRLIGCSSGYMSRLERGDVGAAPETLQAIADALNVPIAAITTGGSMTTSTVAAGTEHHLDDVELHDAKYVAKKIHKSADWVIKATRRGEIEFTRIGRNRWYTDANIADFIRRSRVPAA